MSTSPARRTRSSTSKANLGSTSIVGYQTLMQDPKFVQLVNRLANEKCMKALQDGQIRLVRRREPVVYIPRVDIVNDPESPRYLAVFELPGLKSADINISLKEDFIVVHGNRQSPYTKSNSCNEESCPDAMDIDLVSFHHARTNVRELRYGPFVRRIRVPSATKESDVSATLTEGMLRVTWPKSSHRDDSPSELVKDEPSSPSLSPRSIESSPVILSKGPTTTP